ncbi:MAG TPA: ABC transporter ATP-binding protein [Candidatus Polarisedimenticolaceae bacterium]|nr:ABC transporter ATP-binding protein [Candidatus Polarisedimenticolaceae bacterium]
MIEARGLARRFGAVAALESVDLRVEPGESLALFGANGAGKTTLLRILGLVLRPSAGSLRVGGLDPRRQQQQVLASIGLVSHATWLYEDLTARQNLEFFAALYGVPAPTARAAELLELVELTPRRDDPVRTFSRGMQQRLALARGLVHAPRLVLLDEPFSGLDPHASDVLCRTLAGLRRQGCTLVFATHDVAQGLALSDRWAFLARGRVRQSGDSGTTDPRSLSYT